MKVYSTKPIEVRSETQEGLSYEVVNRKGVWECSCPGFATNERLFGMGYCKHIRKIFQEREGEPYECWYCHTRKAGLQEHHIWRRSEMGHGMPTMWLCGRCHDRATDNDWFEKHLQLLWKQSNFSLTLKK